MRLAVVCIALISPIAFAWDDDDGFKRRSSRKKTKVNYRIDDNDDKEENNVEESRKYQLSKIFGLDSTDNNYPHFLG